MVSSFVTIAGETLSNLDGLTSDDDGISQEIVANNLLGSSDDGNDAKNTRRKLQFSALLATLQPASQQFNKKGTRSQLLKDSA